MAGLQKDTNIKPTVSSAGQPTEQPINFGAPIAQVGEVVRTFVAEHKKDKLTEELKSLGDDVFAAQTGKAVKSATDRISRLKQAKDQGVLTDTMVKIEAETILKESIDSMPAFGAELRQHAARTLGFDPTGSQIEALMNIPKRTGGQTVLEKFQENAQAVAATTGVDPEVVMRLQGQAMFAKQQADLITEQATIGNAGRREIFNATLKEGNGYVSDFMSGLVTQIRAGGIVKPQDTIASIQAQMLGHKQALRDRYAAAGITPDAAELSRDMAGVDEQWKPMMDLANSGSMSTILTDNAKAISSAMTIEGYNVMGDVALMNAAGGQEAVRHYFLTMEKYDKPGQLDLLMKNNPVLARSVQTIGDARKLAAEAYKMVIGVNPSFAGSEEQLSPELKAMKDVVFYDAAKMGGLSEDEKAGRLASARANGQRFKVLGGYFQQGARGAASSDEVQFVTQTFQEEYPKLVERLSAEISSDPHVRVNVQGGRLVIDDYSPTAPTGMMSTGMMGSGIVSMENMRISTAAQADVKRLNSFDLGVKNGWASDFGKNPNSFLQETAAAINAQLAKVEAVQGDLNGAISAFEQNPTPENLDRIRAIDPDLVSEVERGMSGGSVNAK